MTAGALDENPTHVASSKAVLALLVVGLALSALATWSIHTADVEIGAGLRRALPVLRIALYVSLAVQACAVVRAARARPTIPVRAAVYVALFALVAFLVFLQPFWKFYLDLVTVLTCGAIALLSIVGPTIAKWLPRRLTCAADIVLCNACVILIGGELALRAWHVVRPTPLLAATDSSTIARLDRYRQQPGSLYLGFPVNSKGYYDEEFETTGDSKRVVCIGDSFNVGVVPHEFHYTTVAERATKGKIRIDNVGIGGIGPSEYLLLLRRDVVPTKPDAIVISLFVGNDIAEAGKARVGHRALRHVFDRGNIRLYLLPRRLIRIARERRVREGPIGGVQGENAARVSGTEKLLEAFPWLGNPMLERATFTESNFVEEVTRRAETVQPSRRENWERLEADLREMVEVCGDIPFYVIIQAAEWQTNDALWQAVVSKAGRTLDRDAAQRLTREILERLGVPYLDVLPRLRAVKPLPDGQRHLYHLRDTHYNRRGNQVVGRALGDWLLQKQG